jgi:hypothetical protein
MSASAGDDRDRTPRERPQPSALELFKWSAILLAISLAIAALAIPILRWLGFAK